MKTKPNKLTKRQQARRESQAYNDYLNALRKFVKIKIHQHYTNLYIHSCIFCNTTIAANYLGKSSDAIIYANHFEQDHQITDSQTAARVANLLAFT